MPEPAIKEQPEEYDSSGPRFKLHSAEDLLIADAAFHDIAMRNPRWSFHDLYEEVAADANHPLRPYMTSPDKALRKAWIKDLRTIAHELKAYRYIPRNGDKIKVSVRKYVAVASLDEEIDEESQYQVVNFDVARADASILHAVRQSYARRLRACVNEFIGFSDKLARFKVLEHLATAAEKNAAEDK